MIDLEEITKFIQDHLASPRTRSAHVSAPGFQICYVRIGPRFLRGEALERVITLSSLEASKQQSGAFTRLVAMLQAEFPTLPILAENVLHGPLANALRRRGWLDVSGNELESDVSPSYLLRPGA